MAKEDLQPEAKRLYFLGTPIEQIAKVLGVAPKTIWAWHKKFEWKKQMEDHKAETEKETKEIFDKFRKGLATSGAKLFIDLYNKVQNQLENGQNASVDDLVKIGKLVEEITRPANIVINQGSVDVLTSKDVMEAAIRGANNANRGDKTDTEDTGNSVRDKERKGDS